MANDTLAMLKNLSSTLSESKLYGSDAPSLVGVTKDGAGKLHVKNVDCVDVTRSLPKCSLLNFGSAFNPGGGWLTGAQAQEECIARRTTLYASIVDSHFYKVNEKQGNQFYSGNVIYSPVVKVLKTATNVTVTTDWTFSVVTAAAVNMNRVSADAKARVDEVMLRRVRNVLAVMIVNGNRNAVLGAWGCGVFKQDPLKVAGYFKTVLVDEGLLGYFDNVVFAVYKSQENLNAFNTTFKDVTVN